MTEAGRAVYKIIPVGSVACSTTTTILLVVGFMPSNRDILFQFSYANFDLDNRAWQETKFNVTEWPTDLKAARACASKLYGNLSNFILRTEEVGPGGGVFPMTEPKHWTQFVDAAKAEREKDLEKGEGIRIFIVNVVEQ